MKKNIYQDSLVVFEQLQDGQDNVIDIAKTRGFGFFGVMESSSPIYSDISSLVEKKI